MFVLNPDPYLLPSYRISPFRTSDIAFNHTLPDNNGIEEYFDERFIGKKYQYTLNGREAINIALSYYRLQKDDVVTILTTTGNFYISSCVTNEVEKFCKWSRKIEINTKAIIVNHEFGYPYPALGELIKTGLPIIEDCAHSFFSKDKYNTIGNVGEYAIYSFPKMFQIQIGGLLVSNRECELPESIQLRKAEKQYIKNVLSYHIQNKDEIIEKRLTNYSYFSLEYERFGLRERFKLAEGIVPGVFMFRKGENKIELAELKKHFYAHGIQCSVFYGEETFFVPVHQNLNITDCKYIVTVLNKFINF